MSQRTSWRDEPSFEDVYGAMQRRAVLRAKQRLLRSQLEVIQAEIALRVPRNTAMRVVGDTTDAQADLTELRENLLHIEEELDQVEGQIAFHDYHRDMFRALTYRERI